MFNRTFLWLFKAAMLFVRGIVYLPLIFTAYWLTTLCLTKQTNGLIWVGLILLFSYTLYLIVFFCKGILIAAGAVEKPGARMLLRIMLLLPLLAYTCILPIYMIYSPLAHYLHNRIVVWILAGAFGAYVYSRYHFLTNITPRAAYPAYRAGLQTGYAIFHTSAPLQAVQSSNLFVIR